MFTQLILFLTNSIPQHRTCITGVDEVTVTKKTHTGGVHVVKKTSGSRHSCRVYALVKTNNLDNFSHAHYRHLT